MGKLTFSEVLSRIAALDEPQRAQAVAAARQIYGAAIEDEFDLPPVWRTDLLDGRGERINAPPHFDEFVTSPAFMGQPKLFPRQEEFMRRGMSFDPGMVFRRRKTLHTMIALFGKGSGKDWLSSLILAWVCFVISSMADPWGYLKHAPGEPLDVANIATTADQANKVFFNKLKARLKRPCFTQFAPKIGKATIGFNRHHPEFSQPLLLLELHSLHAKAESWEGKSLIFWVMDEADAFEDESGASNADACWLVLKSSAESRFGKRYIGLIISFRRTVDGFMDRMKGYAERYPEDYCFDEAATWEVRADKTKEDFAEHYAIDEIDAAMKYENKAPEAVGAFISDPERVQACVDRSLHPVADVTEITTTIQNPSTGVEQRYVALDIQNIRGNMDKTYFIHGDPGHVDASFAICLMHVETGSAVSRGRDNILDDDYIGDVVQVDGFPYEGAVIVYFNADNVQVMQTKTDKRGRHSTWLRAGQYSYGVYDRMGNLIRHETNLHVKAGVEVMVGTEEKEILEGDDPAIIEEPQRRVVYPVVEDLILEWKPKPRVPVDYNNVEKVLLELCRNFNVLQVSFDKFNSVHLIQNLEAAGVNAMDMSFSQQQQFGIFSNLRMLINEGLVSFLDGDENSAAGRATRQIKRLRNIKNRKIDAAAGEWKDLADARATAAFFACTHDYEVLSDGDGEEATMEDFIFSLS